MADAKLPLGKKRKYTKNHFRLKKNGASAPWATLPSELISSLASQDHCIYICHLALTCRNFRTAIENACKLHQMKLAEGASLPGKTIKPSEWLSLLEHRSLEELRFGVYFIHQYKSAKWNLKLSHRNLSFFFGSDTFRFVPDSKSEHTSYDRGYKHIAMWWYYIVGDQKEGLFISADSPSARIQAFPRLGLTGKCANADQPLDWAFSVIDCGDSLPVVEKKVVIKLIN